MKGGSGVVGLGLGVWLGLGPGVVPTGMGLGVTGKLGFGLGGGVVGPMLGVAVTAGRGDGVRKGWGVDCWRSQVMIWQQKSAGSRETRHRGGTMG